MIDRFFQVVTLYSVMGFNVSGEIPSTVLKQMQRFPPYRP
jgi:hypothetical protein